MSADYGVRLSAIACGSKKLKMKYQTVVVDGYEVNYSTDWINELEQEDHFNWYYHQAELVYKNCSRSESLLEIGVGTGLLSDLLKKRGWNVWTLDIDSEKHPDYCGSALDFDYCAIGADVVLAFEIFEHIPYSTFEKTIKKISESAVKRLYFSLPWNERTLINFSLKLPKLQRIEWSFAVGIGSISTESHFWELARKERQLGNKVLVPLYSLTRVFARYNYRVRLLKKIGCIQYFCAEKF